MLMWQSNEMFTSTIIQTKWHVALLLSNIPSSPPTRPKKPTWLALWKSSWGTELSHSPQEGGWTYLTTTKKKKDKIKQTKVPIAAHVTCGTPILPCPTPTPPSRTDRQSSEEKNGHPVEEAGARSLPPPPPSRHHSHPPSQPPSCPLYILGLGGKQGGDRLQVLEMAHT